jgi:FixJ family two-component response regulator
MATAHNGYTRVSLSPLDSPEHPLRGRWCNFKRHSYTEGMWKGAKPMKHVTEGHFKQTFSLDHRTGRFLKNQLLPVPLFDATRRFSCMFLSASAKDAAILNHHLSAAGIRAYHAADTRELEILAAITTARILLIDIDCTFEPVLEIMQRLDQSRPGFPRVVLTSREDDVWSSILPHFALEVVRKPVHFGELLGALEHARLVEQELNHPERARRRELGVMEAIRSVSQPERSEPVRRSIRTRLSAMMDWVSHAWWKFGCRWTRKQDRHA